MSQYLSEQAGMFPEAPACEEMTLASPRSGAERHSQPHVETMHDVRLAMDNFAALLQSMDFAQELAMLGIPAYAFLKRRKLRKEFSALIICLWRLALERSFPGHWRAMFESFLAHTLEEMDNPDKAAQFEQTVRNYESLLVLRREADFTVAGAHLVDLLKLPEPKAASLRLRLTLHIRSLYTLVFDRLI